MPVETITLNGVPYSAKDVEIAFLGRISRGTTELNISTESETEDLYVLGSKEPIDFTEGKNAYKVDITLLMNEVAGLEIAADGTITDIGRFPITVIYKALPQPMKQILTGCKFKGKALQVQAGSANALAWKCQLHVLGVSGLTRA